MPGPSDVDMASPKTAATPASHVVDVPSTPVPRGTPLREDAIWKRLREAGFDEESVKRRDKDAILAYVTKLESEVLFVIFFLFFSLSLSPISEWLGRVFVFVIQIGLGVGSNYRVPKLKFLSRNFFLQLCD